MAKLPKRLIKKYGISTKAWSVFRKEQGTRKRARPKGKAKAKPRGKPMAKKKKNYRKRGRNIMGMFASKTAIDGYIAEVGKLVATRFISNSPLVEAGVSGIVGVVRNNNTLVAQAVVQAIKVFMPSIAGGRGQGSSIGFRGQ